MAQDKELQDIGLIGLAVMGQNLALNLAEKGWKVSVFNRTASKVSQFVEGPAKNFSIKGFSDLSFFVKSLTFPRTIIIMVKAGEAVDEVISQLLPFLSQGDIIIDGGNSLYLDTNRREAELQKKGLFFIGAGISGGEEGARRGPSIMPGGSIEAWKAVKPYLQSIAAQVEKTPCCDYIGPAGSGHFVKMVHNGIEYADMQLIAETYDFMKTALHMQGSELSSVFSMWNEEKLQSYLIEITAKIFSKRQSDGFFLVDYIQDVAGQKGTGKWTIESGLEYNVPVSVVAEAVFARYLSAMKDVRKKTSVVFSDPKGSQEKISREETLLALQQALYVAKIFCYAQGFVLMREASYKNSWNLNLGNIALLWRGGCIIRSAFLGKIGEAYGKNPALELLILDPYFAKQIKEGTSSLRKIVSLCATYGIPAPCFSAALSWFDSIRKERLPTNLIQAQRDFFGSHTYERTDAPAGQFFHTNWEEE